MILYNFTDELNFAVAAKIVFKLCYHHHFHQTYFLLPIKDITLDTIENKEAQGQSSVF